MKKVYLFILISFFATNGISQRLNNKTKSSSESGIAFRENKGQVCDQFYKQRPDVLFSGADDKFVFHLKKDGISYQLNRIDKLPAENIPASSCFNRASQEAISPVQNTIYRIDVNWLNTNHDVEILKDEPLQAYDNFYLEACPNGALEVKSYHQITYKNIYNGIDLVWHGNDGSLKYDYLVSAYADYNLIRLELKGAEKISIGANGSLIIQTPLGIVEEAKPLVLQNGKQLEANWILKSNYLCFDIKNIDHSKPFVIDPLVRIFGSYYGGANNEEASGVNVDSFGNSYLFGETKSNTSLNMATSGSHQTTYGGGAYYGDAFVAKFNSVGVRQWSTYYGGAQGDFANYCAIDGSGNVYMVGGTSTSNSSVIATPGSHQSMAAGSSSSGAAATDDAYLVKFNSSGARLWGTYYGGSSNEWAYWVEVSASGDIYMSGATHSSDGTSIATIGSHQSTYAGGYSDAFLVKFNALGVRQWATYYGGSGSGQEDGIWCAVDRFGDVYLCGIAASSSGIATGVSHQSTYGGSADAFLAKFNSSGTRLWATYYGGSGSEGYTAGALDALGNIYLSGSTSSGTGTVIATAGSHQSSFGGVTDAFFVKFDPSGNRQWGTYYGGSGADYSGYPSVDSTGYIYFVGYTSINSGTSIATSCNYQSTYAGGTYDPYLTKFTLAGTRLWGTYYGSSFNDYAVGCKADVNSNIYICGTSYDNSGTAMVSTNGHQTVFGGGANDCFFAKFDGCIPTSPPIPSIQSGLKVCKGDSAVLTASLTCGALWYQNSTGNNLLSSSNSFVTGKLLNDTNFYLSEMSCGIEPARTLVHVTITPLPNISIVPSVSPGCVGENITLTGVGGITYTWLPGPFVSTSIPITLFPQISNFIIKGIDANGCKNTGSISINPDPCTDISQNEQNDFKPLIYPNPASAEITIQVNEGSLNKISVTDISGKQITNTISSIGSNKYKIDLTSFSKGIYFLKVETSQGVSVTKMVKE